MTPTTREKLSQFAFAVVFWTGAGAIAAAALVAAGLVGAWLLGVR